MKRDDIAKRVAGSLALGFQLAHIKAGENLPDDWAENVTRRSLELADALIAAEDVATREEHEAWLQLQDQEGEASP